MLGLQIFYFSGRTIRVFFSGDYEFLCRMYGLSGASGEKHGDKKHCTCSNFP